MKKILCILSIIFLFPIVVNASEYNIETSFNNETCVLTVNGNQTGHEATVSIFKNNDLAGFKTNTMTNGKYSVDFVLAYDKETKINITVSNEDGTNEITKTNISIPACEAPTSNNLFNELFDNENSLIKKQGEFEDGDHFLLEDYGVEEIDSKISSSDNDEEKQLLQTVKDAILKEVGEYREFVRVLDSIVRDDRDNDKNFDGYKGGFILNLHVPKEMFNQLTGLKFSTFDVNTLKLSDEILYEYDEEAEIISLNIDNLDLLVAYIDNDYKFLDDTANPSFNPNKANKVKVRVNADYSKFKDVFVDNKKVSKSNYKSEEGSTVITLNEDYLKSLSNGNHTLTVYFNDGHATTTLKVGDNPLTYDNILTYLIIFIVSIGGVISIYKIRKKVMN